MILASGVLLLTAIGLLIAGWLANLELTYIYGSIGATVLAGVCLLVGIRGRRGRADAVAARVGEVSSHVTPVDALLVGDVGALAPTLDGAGTEAVSAQGSVRMESAPGRSADDAVGTTLSPAEPTTGTATMPPVPLMPAIPAPAPSYDDVSADQTGDALPGATGLGAGSEDGAGSGAKAGGVAGTAVTDPDRPGPDDTVGPDRTGPADEAVGPDLVSPHPVRPEPVRPDPVSPGPDGLVRSDADVMAAEPVAEPVAQTSAVRKVTSRKVASTTPRSPQPLSPAESVLVIPDRDRYHRAACRFVRTPNLATTMPRGDAAGRGYQPCGVCKP